MWNNRSKNRLTDVGHPCRFGNFFYTCIKWTSLDFSEPVGERETIFDIFPRRIIFARVWYAIKYESIKCHDFIFFRFFLKIFEQRPSSILYKIDFLKELSRKRKNKKKLDCSSIAGGFDVIRLVDAWMATTIVIDIFFISPPFLSFQSLLKFPNLLATECPPSFSRCQSKR
jgi:hypothetical protein